MQNTPTLYLTQGSGNSFKPALVARQLGFDCNVRYKNVLAGETRQAPFMEINPLGVVPFMTLPNGAGLGESNAIAWYLAEGSALVPDNAMERAQTIRWMNFEQTKLEANISPIRFFSFIAPELGKEHSSMFPTWRDNGNQGLALLDEHLQGRSFLTDYGYCVADVAVYGYTHLANEGGFDLSAFKNISAWIRRVEEQPRYLPIAELLNGVDLDARDIAA